LGARALQAKLSTELGGVESSPDADLLALYGDIRRRERICNKVFAERVDSNAEADAIY